MKPVFRLPLVNMSESDIDLALRTRRQIAWRILPFVFTLYIIAYLDRANVAFAQLPMSAALGFSEAVFGFGAGVFFLGYFLLEIPGAVIVERWSARRWIARILVTWGCFTILVGLVRSPGEFYLTRFLLGAAEASFFPGIIVYLTHWFGARDRARAMAGFVMAAPLSLLLGAPLSALILRVDWLGIPGWRWVFILEGIPAILFGVVTLFYLTDRPRQARWLRSEQQHWIASELEIERRQLHPKGETSLWKALRQGRVIMLAAASLFANIGGYGFILWLPTLLNQRSGLSHSASATYSALPFLLALVSVWMVGLSSDKSGERRFHASVPLLLAAGFLILSALPGQPFHLSLLWLSLTGASAYAWVPAFWVLPTFLAHGSGRAAAIGLINSIGNLGGFVGPTVVGYLLSKRHSFVVAMGFLAACYVSASILTFCIRVPPLHSEGTAHSTDTHSRTEQMTGK
ncbi:MAG: MFS transporter [Acidobacteriota bacterium]